MRFSKLIILLSVFFLVFSCEKKPQASFDFKKRVNGPHTNYETTSEFSAGDSVKLSNTSENGSKFEWIMPDGSNVTDKDVEYVIPSNTGFDELSFNLTVKSKGHCKRNSVSQKVNIIPMSFYTVLNIPSSVSKKYIPYKTSSYSDASNFVVIIEYNDGEVGTYMDYYTLSIYFPPGLPPVNGIYTLQSSSISLPTNGSFISLYGGPIDSPGVTYFTVGQIQVEYINSVMHVYFTDAQTNPTYFKLSAEIYKR